MFIKDHKFNHQCNRCKKSRRNKCDKYHNDDDAKRNVHLKKMSRLRKHISMISMSANAATYHDNDDDDNNVDTAMSFMLTHKLTCITTTLQQKKFIL